MQDLGNVLGRGVVLARRNDIRSWGMRNVCVSQLVDRVGGVAFKASNGRVMAVYLAFSTPCASYTMHTQQRTERKESIRVENEVRRMRCKMGTTHPGPGYIF